mgnify:CR=1 FL=1
MEKPSDFDKEKLIPKPQFAPFSERPRKTTIELAQQKMAPFAERYPEEIIEEEIGVDVGSWQNSATLLAGFSATFITLVLSLVGIPLSIMHQWAVLFFSLAVFLFLFATEFFALAASKPKVKRTRIKSIGTEKASPGSTDLEEIAMKPHLWYDIGAVFYNIGIATFAAGLIILFAIYELIWPVYIALLFILGEMILMGYFLANSIRSKPRNIPIIAGYAIQMVVVTLIIIYAVLLTGII